MFVILCVHKYDLGYFHLLLWIIQHHPVMVLQNGLLLKFDMRETMNPLLSVIGLTSLPIFSIHSLSYNPCHATHKVLTASSAGPCVWKTEDGAERLVLLC